MTQLAAMVYSRRGGGFISPESRTVDGFWIATPPFERLDLECEDHERGETVLRALKASRQDVATPPRSAQLLEPMFELAGVRSFSSFMKEAKAVRLKSDGLLVTATSMRNGGARAGFQFLQDEVDTVPAEPGEVGALLRRALEAADTQAD